jgi:site-specific DNA-adenine methylase
MLPLLFRGSSAEMIKSLARLITLLSVVWGSVEHVLLQMVSVFVWMDPFYKPLLLNQSVYDSILNIISSQDDIFHRHLKVLC